MLPGSRVISPRLLFQAFFCSDNFTLLRLIFSPISMNWQELVHHACKAPPPPPDSLKLKWTKVQGENSSVYRAHKYSLLRCSLCIGAGSDVTVRVDNLIGQGCLTVPNQCDQIIRIARQWWQTGHSQTTVLQGWERCVEQRKGLGPSYCALSS